MEVKPFEKESSVEAEPEEEEHKSEASAHEESKSGLAPEVSQPAEVSEYEASALEDVKLKSGRKSVGKQSAKSNGKRSSQKATPP